MFIVMIFGSFNMRSTVKKKKALLEVYPEKNFNSERFGKKIFLENNQKAFIVDS